MKAAWAAGSYDQIVQAIQPISHHLASTAEVGEGDRVLDVATGTGVRPITAGRAGSATW